MKKTLFLLFLFLPVYMAGQITGEIRLNEKQLQFTKITGYDKIIYGENYINESGKPELPVIRKAYVVPIEAGNIRIETTILQKTEINGRYLVYPTQPPRASGSSNDKDFIQPDPAVYGSPLPFPGKAGEIVANRIVQGYRVIELAIYPVEYLPLEKVIHLYDLSFTVSYDLTGEVSTVPRISERRARLAESLVESMVENPKDVAAYTDRSIIIPESTDLNGKASASTQRSINVLEQLVPDFLIITSNELKSSFQRLADWKIKRGVPTILKTVEEIDVAYPGSDLADKIRNFLKEASKCWNGNGLSVLLGGDVNHVPTKMVKSNGGDAGLFATDLGYVANGFTWDYATNTYSLYDISSYIGRLPAKNPVEADSYISRILNYEKSKQNVDPSYYNNFLITEAYMEPNFEDGHMSYFDKKRKEYLAPYSKYWYLFEHFNCTSTDHEKHEYDHTYGNDLTKVNFLSALKNGVSLGRFHFIYHEDHSITTSLGIASKNAGGSIEQKDLALLPETPYYNIIMSASCHPANFSKDCIAEDFLRYAGTVAFIGNSDIGFRDEYPQFEAVLKALFNTDSSNSSQFNLGYLLLKALAKSSTYLVFTRYKLHLLGDPEMPVWTATPQNLQVNVSKASVVTGENRITVTVNNLPVGQEAVICLMKGNEGYARKTVTGTNPQATFRFVPHTLGKVDVTVTAHNFRPYESTIPVFINQSTAVTISDLVFDDDISGDSWGDGNHQPDAGEIVELTVKLENNSRQTVYGLSGKLRCNSPYILISRNTTDVGNLSPGATGNAKFVFKIDKDAPEILKNDLNAARFMLDLTDVAGVSYPDTFQVNIFAPELKLREQTVIPVWGESNAYQLKVNLMNTGKAQASKLTARLSSANDEISDIPVELSNYPDLSPNATGSNYTTFSYRLNRFASPNNALFYLEVRNEFERVWTFCFNPKDQCAAITQSGLKSRSSNDAISIYWEPVSDASGYNIYRSANGVSGVYTKQNLFPLTSAYYTDNHVDKLKAYCYKVTTLSASGNQSAKSGAIQASTTLPAIGLFPRYSTTSKNITGSVSIADVDYDGKKELFLTEELFDQDNNGYLLGMRHNGEELFDIDGYPSTFSGFARLSTTASATPAIGDLKGDGEQNIITTTWNNYNDNKIHENSVECFASRDNNGDGLPDRLWKFDMDTVRSYRGVVLSNLDNSVDGTMEVIYHNINNLEPIRVIDCNGKLKLKIPMNVANYTMTGVADLDNDGDKEILAVSGTSLYIWHHNGTPFRSNPFFTSDQLLSSPVICDLNNDGKKEILTAGRETTESKIFVVGIDGKCLGGWDGNNAVTRIAYTNYSQDHSLSVGDINRDGKLEVVTLGRDIVKVWKNDGSLLFQRSIPGLFADVKYATNSSAVILADVDGTADQSMPDLVFPVNERIYALHNDGSDIVGFPIQTDNTTTGSVTVADLDQDGKNELVVADGGITYAWKTNGNPDAIEWGSERHDPQNTGEYGKICEPRLILANTTWNGADPCGNVIIQKGTLTVTSAKSLSLTDKTSKIIVRPGASLVVDGGMISNAYVLVLPGGNLTLKNGGAILLRDDAKVRVDLGATFSNLNGKVD